MDKHEQRIVGTIIAIHMSSSKYGGCYGEILGEDGEYYVFSGSHVFRNMSRKALGVKMSFTVVNHNYATHIDQVDKS